MLKDIVTVLIRFLAAFSALSTSAVWLVQIGLGAAYDVPGSSDTNIYFLLAFLGIVFLAGLFWHFAASLAGWLTKGFDQPVDLPEPEGIVAAGSFLIGAYWALSTIGYVTALALHYLTYDPPFMGEDLGAQAGVQRLVDGYEILTFVMALLMMIGCKQVGILFKKLRTLGQQ